MAIRTIVTRGYGNGTFNGTIPLVVLRGYIAGAAGPILGTAKHNQGTLVGLKHMMGI
jgi:hypothetical protein